MDWKKIGDLTMPQVINFALKNKVRIIVTILIVVFVLLSIFSNSFREHFLFDRYGKFQWIGVSAIFAGVGIYLNSILKREETRANILTKNDLEVLKDFRENASEFSALVWKYNNVLNEVLEYSRQNKILEINFNAKFSEEEKTDSNEYYNLKGNELNDMYFHIRELYTKIYFDLTIRFDTYAENVNNSLTTIIRLLDEAIASNEKIQSFEDIQSRYKNIIEANDLFTIRAQSYIVLVMKNKVSSFDSKIIKDNENV